MLIGQGKNKPSLAAVRRIKAVLSQALVIETDAIVTVSQLACLEDGCAPLETVIGLLQKGTPQQQYKIHKPTDEITADDLLPVCRAWGYDVQITTINKLFKEN